MPFRAFFFRIGAVQVPASPYNRLDRHFEPFTTSHVTLASCPRSHILHKRRNLHGLKAYMSSLALQFAPFTLCEMTGEILVGSVR